MAECGRDDDKPPLYDISKLFNVPYYCDKNLKTKLRSKLILPLENIFKLTE